jgi:hypothetical protein
MAAFLMVFTCQVDDNNLQGASGSTRGMIYRGDGSLPNYYDFRISSSGRYSISKCENGGVDYFQYLQIHDAIHTGYDAWNTLKAVCRGETIDFYCNGVFIATWTDSGGSSSGKVGVICLDYNNYDYISHFDNVSLVADTP